MPVNYTTSNTPVTVNSGSTQGSGFTNPLSLTLTPIQPSSQTYVISASSFSISGKEPIVIDGNFNSYRAGINDVSFINTAIDYVTFSDTGTAGTIGNTVLVNVYMVLDFEMPVNNLNLFLDIDGDAVLLAVVDENIDNPDGVLTTLSLSMVNGLSGFGSDPSVTYDAGSSEIVQGAAASPGFFENINIINFNGDNVYSLVASTFPGSSAAVEVPMYVPYSSEYSTATNVLTDWDNGCLDGNCYGNQQFSGQTGSPLGVNYWQSMFRVTPNVGFSISRHSFKPTSFGDVTSQTIEAIELFEEQILSNNLSVNVFNSFVAPLIRGEELKHIGLTPENYDNRTVFAQTVYTNVTAYVSSNLSESITLEKIVVIDSAQVPPTGGGGGLPQENASDYIGNEVRIVVYGLNNYIVPGVNTTLYVPFENPVLMQLNGEEPSVEFNLTIEVPLLEQQEVYIPNQYAPINK